MSIQKIGVALTLVRPRDNPQSAPAAAWPSVQSEIARSIAVGKDECQVVDLLHGRILSIPLYLGNSMLTLLMARRSVDCTVPTPLH
jgi:hypothetical protein